MVDADPCWKTLARRGRNWIDVSWVIGMSLVEVAA
jgi:hypothetical protein